MTPYQQNRPTGMTPNAVHQPIMGPYTQHTTVTGLEWALTRSNHSVLQMWKNGVKQLAYPTVHTALNIVQKFMGICHTHAAYGPNTPNIS
jgi:hypothetical protein